jgi:hypothetical protein
MTTPDPATIANAVATALESVEVRVVPYLPDNPSPPCALVNLETVDYHGAFGGGDVVHQFTVYLIVSRIDERAADATLKAFMSQKGGTSTSVQGALESDQTLGGVVSSCIVRKSGPPAPVIIGDGVIYLSCPFILEVHA